MWNKHLATSEITVTNSSRNFLLNIKSVIIDVCIGPGVAYFNSSISAFYLHNSEGDVSSGSLLWELS